MTIAFDIDLFCDDKGVVSSGMVDVLYGIWTMNQKNKIYVWSTKGIQDARTRGHRANLPSFVSYQDRRLPDTMPRLSFLKKGTLPKGNMVIWAD